MKRKVNLLLTVLAAVMLLGFAMLVTDGAFQPAVQTVNVTTQSGGGFVFE